MNGNGSGEQPWMKVVRSWGTFLLVLGALATGLWLVAKPAVDTQYCSAGRCDVLEKNVSEQALSESTLDGRLKVIETNIGWLVKDKGMEPASVNDPTVRKRHGR